MTLIVSSMFLFWESAGVPLHDSQFRTFASYKRPWFILQTVVAPTTLKTLSSDWQPFKGFQ